MSLLVYSLVVSGLISVLVESKFCSAFKNDFDNKN